MARSKINTTTMQSCTSFSTQEQAREGVNLARKRQSSGRIASCEACMWLSWSLMLV